MKDTRQTAAEVWSKRHDVGGNVMKTLTGKQVVLETRSFQELLQRRGITKFKKTTNFQDERNQEVFKRLQIFRRLLVMCYGDDVEGMTLDSGRQTAGVALTRLSKLDVRGYLDLHYCC